MKRELMKCVLCLKHIRLNGRRSICSGCQNDCKNIHIKNLGITMQRRIEFEIQKEKENDNS